MVVLGIHIDKKKIVLGMMNTLRCLLINRFDADVLQDLFRLPMYIDKPKFDYNDNLFN